MIEQIILVVHVLVAIAIVALILLQQGKGADAGASFGGGGSQTVFGPTGGGNVLTRATAILATVFFITSFSLAIYAKQKATGVDMNVSEFDQFNEIAEQEDVPELEIPEGVNIDSVENTIIENASTPEDIIESSSGSDDIVDGLPQ